MMGRDILSIQLVTPSGNCLCLCSHLESCKESSQVRTDQLRQLFLCMIEFKGFVFIAGDLNIRDEEVKSAVANVNIHSKSSNTIYDAWAMAGKSEQNKFTWWVPSKPSIRYRFDRIFYNSNKVSLDCFALLG